MTGLDEFRAGTSRNPLPCRWCLATPPRHDRCDGVVWAKPTWVPCPCECRRQEGLW